MKEILGQSLALRSKKQSKVQILDLFSIVIFKEVWDAISQRTPMTEKIRERKSRT